jgi:hypothetical protein
MENDQVMPDVSSNSLYILHQIDYKLHFANQKTASCKSFIFDLSLKLKCIAHSSLVSWLVKMPLSLSKLLHSKSDCGTNAYFNEWEVEISICSVKEDSTVNRNEDKRSTSLWSSLSLTCLRHVNALNVIMEQCDTNMWTATTLIFDLYEACFR